MLRPRRFAATLEAQRLVQQRGTMDEFEEDWEREDVRFWASCWPPGRSSTAGQGRATARACSPLYRAWALAWPRRDVWMVIRPLRRCSERMRRRLDRPSRPRSRTSPCSRPRQWAMPQTRQPSGERRCRTWRGVRRSGRAVTKRWVGARLARAAASAPSLRLHGRARRTAHAPAGLYASRTRPCAAWLRRPLHTARSRRPERTMGRAARAGEAGASRTQRWAAAPHNP